MGWTIAKKEAALKGQLPNNFKTIKLWSLLVTWILNKIGV